METTSSTHTLRAGWPVGDFADAAGVSRALIYTLPKEIWPRSVKIGKRRLITEQPADWLRRVGQATEA